MKWIGQHIWDFISRFRSDVYLEDLADPGSDTDKFLVVDTNNKVGYRTGAEVLSDIGASSESTDLEFNGSTANGVLTYGGAAQIDVESILTFDSSVARLTLADPGVPSIRLNHTADNTVPAQLDFWNTRGGGNGTNSDSLGKITFGGQDGSGNDQHIYASIFANIEEATHTDEAGKMHLVVGTSDGTTPDQQQALTATGHATNNTVDVGLGYGTASTTTIAGNAVVSGDGLTLGHDDDGIFTIQKLAHSDGNGGRLYIKGADATDGQTDKNGGPINFYGGRSTGTGNMGHFTWYAGREAASTGTGLNSSEAISKLESVGSGVTGSTNQYWFEGGGVGGLDYFKLSVAAHGSTTLSTVDNDASAADLTFDVDGEIVLDAHTGEDIFFKENGTERFHFHLDSTPTLEATGDFRITGDGEVTLGSSGGDITLLPTGGDVVIEDDSTNKPELTLKTTATGNKPPVFTFLSDRGEAGEDGDYIGNIYFKSDNELQQEERFCEIVGTIADATDGQEAGKLELKTRVHGAATHITGLSIDGDTNATGELNVTMGAGSSTVSTTAAEIDLTTTGALDINADTIIDMTTAGTLDVNANALAMDLTDSSDILLTASEDAEDFTIRVAGSHDTSLVLRGDGTGNDPIKLMAANGPISMETDDVIIQSSSDEKPLVNIKSTTNSNRGSELRFTSDKGAAGADGDYMGAISFYGDNAAQEQTSFASIQGRVVTAADTDEAGTLIFKTTTSDGTTSALQTGLDLSGHGTNNDIDVNIGYGTSSITTIAGNLTTNGESVLFTSSTSQKPVVEIRNTTSDGTGPTLKLNNTNNGGDGGDGDFAGKIEFTAMDDGTPTETIYAQIYSRIDDATSTEESGSLSFLVANHDGGLGTGLKLTGGAVDDEIDVDIGLGTTSTTTVGGKLDITGSRVDILNQGALYFFDSDNSHSTRIIHNTASDNRTIQLPDADGTVQLTGSNAGQTFNVPLKVDDLYILYVSSQNVWYHTGYAGQSFGTSISAESDSTAMRAVSYVAPAACKVNKVVVAFYTSSGTADLEFQVTKIPLVDDSTSNVTCAAMTHNDINFSMANNTNYVKTMTMTGGGSDDNHLSAGQAFTLAIRRTDATGTRVLYGNCFAEIELT